MKKKENIVGIIPAEKKEKNIAAKKEKRIRPYWGKIVSVFFNFYESKLGERPSFVNGDPRYLGVIIDAIEKKSIEKNNKWTEDIAIRSFTLFLDYCFADKWLHSNFLLFNMSRQMDRIFIKISNDFKNGKSTPVKEQQHSGSFKTAGQDIFADRLRERIEKLK